MAKSAPETILLRGDPNRFEFDAAGAITPGHLLEMTSSGTVQVHATAGGNQGRLFAVENDIFGDGIDHAYAATEVVQVNVARVGDVVYARLKDGENVAKGAYLESAGDGTLQAITPNNTGVDYPPASIVGMALEAVDMSGTAAADPSGLIAVLIV